MKIKNKNRIHPFHKSPIAPDTAFAPKNINITGGQLINEALLSIKNMPAG